jgi:mono/diheme cytochrome c family protein
MKGFGLRRGHATAACAAACALLAACAPLPSRPAPVPAPLATSASAGAAPRPAGGKIFDKWCGDCHATPGGPGSMALQRKYQGTLPAILEQRSNLAPEYVALAVRRGVSFMPSFRKTEISDAELALVAGYLAKQP